MKVPRINLKNISPIYKGIVTLIVTLIVTQYLSIRLFNVIKENENLQVKHEALQLKNQLQNILNHSENATRVISFLVENNFSETYFDSISKQIVTENKFIDALQIIEGNTIVKTFPLEGNEKTIGYKVLEEPKHANEAKISVKRNSLYFEGPIPLIQGGEGVVGRLPIYKKNKLWGFSSVIIRKETLLKAIGFDTNEKLHFCYQVSKVDNPNFAFFKMEKPTDTKVYYQTHLDSGNWQISVWNKSPQYNNRAMQFSILGILFSITLGILIYILTNQPYKLRKIVAEKTHNLEVANKDLEKRAQELIVSNKELEQFAYVASHDLQEPLRMITNFLTQIERKYSDVLDDKGKTYIQFAVDGAKRMKTMILDILEFSRVGKYDETATEIDTNKLIQRINLMYLDSLQQKNIDLIYFNLPVIIGHELPLQQVFSNLISNAIKYASTEKKPIIKISCQEQDDFWLFSVQDNGIGIPEEYYEKIFIIFQRLHAKTEYSGSGVGLSIVKKIIEKLGGKIWLQSKVNEGTTFYFTVVKKAENLV